MQYQASPTFRSPILPSATRLRPSSDACGRDAVYVVMQERSRLRRAAGKEGSFRRGPCAFGRRLATCAVWVGPRSKCTQDTVQNGLTELYGPCHVEAQGKNFHPYHRASVGCAGRPCFVFRILRLCRLQVKREKVLPFPYPSVQGARV